MFIDSHCHLDRIDLAPFDGDFGGFMAAAGAAGVQAMLCVAIDLESYPDMRRLVEDYPQIQISVGVHPNERDACEATVEELAVLAADRRVVAVGETGLDYFHGAAGSPEQQERFRRHIVAAKRVRKPLIVHLRNAREDTLRMLEEAGAAEVGGVLHCFTEDWETARRALDLNFYISFSGIVTFKNAAAIQEAARKVPSDRYLIETDSPYLAPVPHRGKPNYPYYVREVAQKLAELRGCTLERVAVESTANYRELFGPAN